VRGGRGRRGPHDDQAVLFSNHLGIRGAGCVYHKDALQIQGALPLALGGEADHSQLSRPLGPLSSAVGCCPEGDPPHLVVYIGAEDDYAPPGPPQEFPQRHLIYCHNRGEEHQVELEEAEIKGIVNHH
jgi:hypothetical protein